MAVSHDIVIIRRGMALPMIFSHRRSLHCRTLHRRSTFSWFLDCAPRLTTAKEHITRMGEFVKRRDTDPLFTSGVPLYVGSQALLINGRTVPIPVFPYRCRCYLVKCFT